MPIYKDKERGTYYVKIVYRDYEGNKKQKKKRGFKKKNDAVAWEKEFHKKHNESSDMSFASLVELYMEDIVHRIRPNTFENKKYIINSRILPFFSKIAINEIKPMHIRKWQNTLISQGFSQTYLKTINNQLNAILNFAVKFYGLSANPSKVVGSIGKKQADSMNFWTLEEFNLFYEQLEKEESKVIFSILFWTGIRSGELLGLQWKDIDLLSNTISITKSLQKVNGETVINPPKTPKSKRIIHIPLALSALIVKYKNKLYKPKHNDFLFDCSKYYVLYELRRGIKKANIKKIRVHDLRHSHASLLIELGYSPLLISERLGHEKIETTLQVYSHLYPNKHDAVAKKLNNLMEQKSSI
ncbi:TPA: tyrosine-type recombinase/integrase [Bacillus thuringiensis]|uniref:Integrase n=4 Tax=root TaxID=1 RepID=A0A0S2MV79_9CAUD|nr:MULTISPECIES: site-specific integrase [Bacillus cereus group]YP_009218159.1 integrase [Bacillus phage phi4J1]AHZ49044.1 phage integrase family protein [Bacillus thuringiensis serovar kurstaki str. YBT-1520]AIM28483.1 phage integrase [Bacillus thuringiensis serovar kurstaki str. YBT-1520]AJA17559.1 integrase [Bacillus thuringiensis serovar galleriae]ALO79832.1 site-specific recombinase [Bacillus phage phi4J1]ETE97355.1 integrase [Bacillus thuringiensis serovar aizawai str. Hu4-2]